MPEEPHIYVLSDLCLSPSPKHLRLLQQLPIQLDITRQNILCLCGDIGYPHSKIYKAFIEMCSNAFAKVFVIAGNHEYYSSEYTMEEINHRIEYVCNQYPNVSFLNRTSEMYAGILFMGTTLWSNLKQDTNQHIFRIHYWNDFQHIICDNKHALTPDCYDQMHNRDVAWIFETLLMTAAEQPVVILTHHLPMEDGIPVNPMNFMFATNLEAIMDIHDNIRYWFAGNISTDMVFRDTRIVVNSVMYSGTWSKRVGG